MALLALILIFFENISKKLKVRTAFKQGNQFLKQKSFNEAIAQYNQLLNIDSNYFQAWTNRGYALAGLQQYGEMRESCSTATIIDPTAVYAWNCQGEALHNLQRAEEAILAFDKAIALDQTDPIFLMNKSESLKAIGKEEESLVTISEAIKVLEQIEDTRGKERVRGEFAVALTFLGNGYRNKEQYKTAISNYNRALEYSPNYFPAQIGKGIVLKRLKRYQQAQKEFENILKNKQLSTTKQAQTWFYLGTTLCQSQSRSSGIDAFEQAIKLVPDYQAAQQAKQNCI
nr:tetratricopeptide repeat protein [Waterburya agarophytonicola]